MKHIFQAQHLNSMLELEVLADKSDKVYDLCWPKMFSKHHEHLKIKCFIEILITINKNALGFLYTSHKAC